MLPIYIMLHNISGCLQNGECTIWGVQCFILCRHFGAAQMMKTTRHAKLLLVLPPVIGRVRAICCFAWYVSLPNKNATTSTFALSLVSSLVLMMVQYYVSSTIFYVFRLSSPVVVMNTTALQSTVVRSKKLYMKIIT